MPSYYVQFAWCLGQPPPAPLTLIASSIEEAARKVKATADREVTIATITLIQNVGTGTRLQPKDQSGTTRETENPNHLH